MTNEGLEKWHDEIFWPKYGIFIKTPFPNQWGAGGKGESKKKILQLKPSSELRLKIELALDAQTSHRRKIYERFGSADKYNNHVTPLAKGGIAVYKNRQARTFIHNIGWDDEIPSLQEIANTSFLPLCECGKEVHGKSFDKCYECIGKEAHGEIYANLVKMGLGKLKSETFSEWCERCKAARPEVRMR